MENQFFIAEDKEFRFFAINLRITPETEIIRVLDACEAVERTNWNAQEDFRQFIKKCTDLIYATKNGEIIGFLLVSQGFFHKSRTLVYEEGMVLKESQNKRLGLKLLVIATRLYLKSFKNQSRFFTETTFVINTCNMALINKMYKKSIFLNLMTHSFRPSEDLMHIRKKIISSKKFRLIDKNHPFFLKSVFPGAQKAKRKLIRPARGLRKIMPDNFDPIQRGDTFLMIVRASLLTSWIWTSLFLYSTFGPGIFFNKKIGIIRSIPWFIKKNVEKTIRQDQYQDRRA